MTKGQKIILIFLGIIVLVCLTYKASYPTYSWNQKLTVEIETPEGDVSSSSVVKVIADVKVTLGLPEVARMIYVVQGEATFIELPNQKHLFVLLGDYGDEVAMAHNSFKEDLLGDVNARVTDNKDYISRISKHKGVSVPLMRDRYPLFVTFDDINDPASLKEVDPDDLASVFGEGYNLTSVMIEITDEDVSEGSVKRVLTWYDNLSVPIGGKSRRNYGDPLYGLGKWNFISRSE